jgi:CMP-N-acetylneuraminic acid synthetase
VPEFQKNKTLWKGKVGSYQLPELKVQDIDTLEDWMQAEIKYSQLHK